ncbi:hypothetical protein HII31_05102 [Pseudocercospora fuligena]|uniref:Uncharacterized protein n=1 Tax=Pseudocercospora fuligena TaxID=685502 RepID=A0A8H6VKA8_9PEZI|nr:hypothetical protein HII31_05102 [Pseudocercospora fuligena]
MLVSKTLLREDILQVVNAAVSCSETAIAELYTCYTTRAASSLFAYDMYISLILLRRAHPKSPRPALAAVSRHEGVLEDVLAPRYPYNLVSDIELQCVPLQACGLAQTGQSAHTRDVDKSVQHDSSARMSVALEGGQRHDSQQTELTMLASARRFFSAVGLVVVSEIAPG